MYIKEWKQYKKVLSEKMKDEEAFTLIELIVVMAILAVLVLLAAPQFLGYTTKAKDAKIANDLAVAEMKTSENLIDHKWAEKDFKEWHNADNDENIFDRDYLIENIVIADDDGSGKNGLYNKAGKVELTDEEADEATGLSGQEKLNYYSEKIGNDIPEGNYRVVEKEFLIDEVSTTLVGAFFANENGDVFYSPDENLIKETKLVDSNGNVVQNPTNPSTPEDGNVEETIDGIPSHYVLASMDDFVEFKGWYAMGSYAYVGDDEYIIIPKEITDYSLLFGRHGLSVPDMRDPNGEHIVETIQHTNEHPDYEATGITKSIGRIFNDGNGYQFEPSDDGSEVYISKDGKRFGFNASDVADEKYFNYYDYNPEGEVKPGLIIPIDNNDNYKVWTGPTIVDVLSEEAEHTWTGDYVTLDYSNLKGVATEVSQSVSDASMMFAYFPTESLELTNLKIDSVERYMDGFFTGTKFTELDLSSVSFTNLGTGSIDMFYYTDFTKFGDNSIAVGSQSDKESLITNLTYIDKGADAERVFYVK